MTRFGTARAIYREVHGHFERILGQYIDIGNAVVHDHLLEVERANIKLFGYGAKGMTLSMLETAVALTSERISARHLHEIIQLGKEVLTHPVELLAGIDEAAVAEVAARISGGVDHQGRSVPSGKQSRQIRSVVPVRPH